MNLNSQSQFYISSEKESIFSKLDPLQTSELKQSAKLYNEQYYILTTDGPYTPQILETEKELILIWSDHDARAYSSKDLIKLYKKSKIDGFLTFNKKKRDITWAENIFSKVPILYKLSESGITISSDIFSLGSNKEVVPEAKKTFETLGWLPPELSPWKDVLVSEEESVYYYNHKDKSLKVKKTKTDFPTSFDDSITTDEINSALKDCVISTSNKTNVFHLTGGADTRLIYNSLPNHKNIIFLFNHYSTNQLGINEDAEVFDLITREESLKYVKIKDNELEKSNYHPLPKLSKIKKLLPSSGLFGGEILGGSVFNALTGGEFFKGDNYQQDIFLSDIKENYIDKKILENYFQPPNPKSCARFFKAFYRTLISDTYYPTSVTWEEPVKKTLTNSYKPYLDSRLLYKISTINPKRLKNRSLLKEIYLNHASHLLKYPFVSGITLMGEDNRFKSFTLEKDGTHPLLKLSALKPEEDKSITRRKIFEKYFE